MNANRKLRMGVIGLGHFGQAAVLPAFQQLATTELKAIVSGSDNKRSQVGNRYHVADRLDYHELDYYLSTGALDAVYLALPPDLHAEYTVRCARYGIHVLCEKPMAPSDHECRAMIRACEIADVKLMIAYRLHFEAANLAAIRLCQSGRLGYPRYFCSHFSSQVRERNIRVQARPGAGPLWDLGVYCVNAARYLFRSEPSEVSAMSFANRADRRFHHVDEQIGAVLRFPGECCATFLAGFGAHDRARYEIVCTDGAVALENSYEYTDDIVMTIYNGAEPRTRTFSKRDQIAAEIEYFSRCILDNRHPEPSGHEGLADVQILQALDRSARSGRVEELRIPARSVRPSAGQEIAIPSHEKPYLVDVESAMH